MKLFNEYPPQPTISVFIDNQKRESKNKINFIAIHQFFVNECTRRKYLNTISDDERF